MYVVLSLIILTLVFFFFFFFSGTHLYISVLYFLVSFKQEWPLTLYVINLNLFIMRGYNHLATSVTIIEPLHI